MTTPLIMGPEPTPDAGFPGDHIWGWMSNVECWWLHDTAATMDSVVEIGSLHGRSSFALLTGCKGPVYCVDPWYDEGGHCYRSFMRSCGHFENLRALQTYSLPAADTMRALSFGYAAVDMTFIDADHAYESVKQDIAAWLPLTRRLICGHDYLPGPDAGYPGVAQAVNEVFGERVNVGEGTSIWWVEL